MDEILNDIHNQIEIYNEALKKDEEHLFWENINLNDPVEIVKHLAKKTSSTKNYLEFINTLVALCTINSKTSILWTSLPKLVLSITNKEIIKSDDNIEVVDDETKDHHDIVLTDFDKLKTILDNSVSIDETELESKQLKMINELETKVEHLQRERMNLKKENQKINDATTRINKLVKDNKVLKKQLKEAKQYANDIAKNKFRYYVLLHYAIPLLDV